MSGVSHFSFALLAALAVALPHAGAADDSAARSLAEAERAFARACVAGGIRSSFVDFFAEDGIFFNPNPVNARQTMLARPAPASRPPVTLDWWPEFVRVSRSGDFGISTGPSRFSADPGTPDAPPPRDGYFLSIWKRPPGGSWKVALDIGVECPLGNLAPREQARLSRVAGSERNRATPSDLAKLHEAVGQDVASGGCARFAADGRLQRDGDPIAVGAAAATAAWRKLPAATRYEPAAAEMASSGDLAVTYGRVIYETPPRTPAIGWLFHVWERDEASGEWRILAAVCPAPNEGKP